MELPIRKQNRACDFDYSQNGAYFVTICTFDRKMILSQIVGDGFPVPNAIGIIAEEMIRQIPNKYPNVRVDKYVIMPDHIHILLMIDSGNEAANHYPTLGNIIEWYKYQVTKQANQLSGIPGERIFQRSYYDHIIRNRNDYLEIWQYIDDNPRKWLYQHQAVE